MSRVSGFIELVLGSKQLAESVAKALTVEAENPPDPGRGRVSIETRDNRVIVSIEARDLSAARTLFNTYLSLAVSVVDTLLSVERRYG